PSAPAPFPCTTLFRSLLGPRTPEARRSASRADSERLLRSSAAASRAPADPPPPGCAPDQAADRSAHSTAEQRDSRRPPPPAGRADRKSTRLNSSHQII